MPGPPHKPCHSRTTNHACHPSWQLSLKHCTKLDFLDFLDPDCSRFYAQTRKLFPDQSGASMAGSAKRYGDHGPAGHRGAVSSLILPPSSCSCSLVLGRCPDKLLG